MHKGEWSASNNWVPFLKSSDFEKPQPACLWLTLKNGLLETYPIFQRAPLLEQRRWKRGAWKGVQGFPPKSKGTISLSQSLFHLYRKCFCISKSEESEIPVYKCNQTNAQQLRNVQWWIQLPSGLGEEQEGGKRRHGKIKDLMGFLKQ